MDGEAAHDYADTGIPVTPDGVRITPIINVCEALPRNPLDEVTSELHRLVQAVQTSEAANPAGTVTLTFKVSRSKNIQDAVLISSDVATKLPKEPKLAAVLFVDDDGNLTERNPNQRDMFREPRGV